MENRRGRTKCRGQEEMTNTVKRLFKHGKDCPLSIKGADKVGFLCVCFRGKWCTECPSRLRLGVEGMEHLDGECVSSEDKLTDK